MPNKKISEFTEKTDTLGTDKILIERTEVGYSQTKDNFLQDVNLNIGNKANQSDLDALGLSVPTSGTYAGMLCITYPE